MKRRHTWTLHLGAYGCFVYPRIPSPRGIESDIYFHTFVSVLFVVFRSGDRQIHPMVQYLKVLGWACKRCPPNKQLNEAILALDILSVNGTESTLSWSWIVDFFTSLQTSEVRDTSNRVCLFFLNNPLISPSKRHMSPTSRGSICG